METLSKQQVAEIIQKAPSGTKPADIVNGLVSRGYKLEGYNDSIAKMTEIPQSEDQKLFESSKKLGAENPNFSHRLTPQGQLISKVGDKYRTLDVTGATLGSGVVSEAQKLIKPLAEKALISATEKASSKANQIVNQIVRGTKGLKIEDAKTALLSIPKNVVKGKDATIKLATELGSKSKSLTSALTKELSKDPNLYKGNDLKVVEKIGDKTIKTDYVNQAIKHLKEYYTKTIEPKGLETIKQLENKVKTQGLNQVEINNLAKEYGSKLTKDFFAKSGDLLKGANAKASESIRSGLKETSRSIYKMWNQTDAPLKVLDKANSQVINTQKAINKIADAARIAESKVRQAGVGGKLKELGVSAVDLATGGILKGIIKKAMTGTTEKAVSVLELNKKLPTLLKDLTKFNAGKTFNISLLKKIIGK
ncbi:MAG: hypothetical protein WCN88_04875 [Candidatus Falkowbacteria bacterium]